MTGIKGRIINKESLVNGSPYVKEQYEGLLVCMNQDGLYNIAVQLNDNDILVVDKAKETNVRERIQNWAAQVQDIQNKYGTTDYQQPNLQD